MERRHHRSRLFGAARTSKENEPASDSQERLKGRKRPLLQTDRPHRQDIKAFQKLRTRQQRLVTRGLHGGIRQGELADRLAKEGGLPGFYLYHQQAGLRRGELHRNPRRASAGPDVHLSHRSSGEVARRDQRLQKEPIDGRIGIIERGQIDLAVPAGQQLVIGEQSVGELVGNEEVRFCGPA